MTVAFGTPQWTTGTQSGGVGVTGAPLACTTGSTLIVIPLMGTSDTGTITDSANNTYVQVGTNVDDVSDGSRVQVWCAFNATGGNVAATVKRTFNAALSFYFIELQGAAASSVLDKFASVPDTGSPATCPVTTTSAVAGLLSFFMYQGGATNTVVTAGSGWAVVSAAGSAAGTSKPSALLTKTVTSVGTYDPNPTYNPTAGHASILTVAFKGASVQVINTQITPNPAVL